MVQTVALTPLRLWGVWMLLGALLLSSSLRASVSMDTVLRSPSLQPKESRTKNDEEGKRGSCSDAARGSPTDMLAA